MPNTFINLGFEDAGALAGWAAGWTVAIVTTAEKFAAYQTPDDSPVENFEGGWSNAVWSDEFAPGDVVLALFDALNEKSEDFEEEWTGGETQMHYTDLPGAVYAPYDVGVPADHEDFEQEWSDNENDQQAFAPGDTTNALYDTGTPEDREDFEEEWKSNQNDKLVLDPGDIVEAAYDDNVIELWEDFEECDLRIATVIVTAEGIDGTIYSVKINGTPAKYNYAGVGGITGIRDQLVTRINAIQLGVVASPEGAADIKIRAKVSGDTASITVETVNGGGLDVTLPDKNVYWTQTSEIDL